MSVLQTMHELWGRGQGHLPTFYPERSRRELAKLMAAACMTSGAEIGVGTGLYSKMLFNRNPGLRLLCVDAWETYAGISQSTQDAIYERAMLRLSGLNATIQRQHSLDAASAVEDGSLDFVYIDASHTLRDVVDDIAAWEPKVRAGGIVAGHDFTYNRFWPGSLTRESLKHGPRHRPCHVIDAVLAWTHCYRIEPWFVLDGQTSTASWMWVKQ